MTEDLTLIEAALFQLKAAAASVDEMSAAQMKLTVNVLSSAVAAAQQGLSPAAVNDIEFALNDVAAMVQELSAADADRIGPIVKSLQDDVERLKQSTALPPAVLNAIRALQAKLKVRKTAIERQGFRPEGTPEAPLPHPPEDLQREAAPLRKLLAAAGFATPALDGLIADPATLRFHSISEILNELDVIAG